MNTSPATPTLGEQKAAELPVRLLQSPYFVLRTPIGGYFLDPAYNKQMVKHPTERLARFLADAERKETGRGQGEVRYTARPSQRPLRYLNEGTIREFEQAARQFVERAQTSDQAVLRRAFRLPDPAKEPDAYWVWGERFAPQLMVLWGCEKEENSSLPLVGEGRTAVSELRARTMTWGRQFREGLELSCERDDLRQFIAFPELDAAGKLIGLRRWVNGQFVTEEVQRRWFQFWKIRPLKAVPASSVLEFERVAKEFYRKGHPTGCVCAACAPATAEAKAGAAAPTGVPGPTYEQEVRKGFQLPDPDQHPHAYYVYGRPFAGRLLVVLPYPDIKDADDIQQAERQIATTKNKAALQEIKQQYDKDLPLHNQFKRFLYEKPDCLPLVQDAVLGIPTPLDRPTEPAGAPTLHAPASPAAKAQGRDVAADLTVTDKLWNRCINWRRLGLILAAIVALCAAAAFGFYLWMPKAIHLAPPLVANEKETDPDNARNVLRLSFDQALAKSRGAPADAWGRFSLRGAGGKEMKLRAPRPAGPSGLLLVLDEPNAAFQEGIQYQLTAEGTRDTWHNTLRPTNVSFQFVDKRTPSLLASRVGPASAESDNQLTAETDEPMDPVSATVATNYTVSGMVVTRADLRENGRAIVLTTERPFESGAKYTLEARNLTDAARARNPLGPVRTEFTWAPVPLRLYGEPRADRAQNRVRVEFNRRVDVSSGPPTPVFRIDKASIERLEASDDGRAVEFVLRPPGLLSNVEYQLTIVKLKDKAGGELTTNVMFRYSGPVDNTPPEVRDVTKPTARVLEVTWNESLSRTTAENPANYRLEMRVDNQWKNTGLPLRPQMVVSNVVQLRLDRDLEYGAYRLHHQGVEDLVGNKTTKDHEFKNSNLGVGPATRDQEVLPSQTAIRMKVSGLIDKNATSPANFVLRHESTGKKVPDATVTAVQIEHKGSISEITLTLSAKVTTDARACFLHLKLQGEIQPWEDQELTRLMRKAGE
jgi:hypothetical protein